MGLQGKSIKISASKYNLRITNFPSQNMIKTYFRVFFFVFVSYINSITVFDFPIFPDIITRRDGGNVNGETKQIE